MSACTYCVHAYRSMHTDAGVCTCRPQASVNMSLRNPADIPAKISSRSSRPLPAPSGPLNIWSHLVLIYFYQIGLGSLPGPGREARFSPSSLGILCKLTWLQAHLAACSGFLCVLHLPCDVACPKANRSPLSQTPHPQSNRLKAAGRWLFPGSVTALTVDKPKGENLDSP